MRCVAARVSVRSQRNGVERNRQRKRHAARVRSNQNVSAQTDLVLDVHLAALLVGGLTGEGVVDPEVVREFLLDHLPVVIVQERVAVGNAQEQPGKPLCTCVCVRVRLKCG